MGKEPNSFHRASEQAMTDLMNQSQHIQKVLENFNSDQIASNRLRLKASMILYIEKEIAAKFGTESIIDDFRDLKER